MCAHIRVAFPLTCLEESSTSRSRTGREQPIMLDLDRNSSQLTLHDSILCTLSTARKTTWSTRKQCSPVGNLPKNIPQAPGLTMRNQGQHLVTGVTLYDFGAFAEGLRPPRNHLFMKVIRQAFICQEPVSFSFRGITAFVDSPEQGADSPPDRAAGLLRSRPVRWWTIYQVPRREHSP